MRGLKKMVRVLKDSDGALYDSWNYEQGEPMLIFRRDADRVLVRAIEDEGRGETEEYSCGLDELVVAVEHALADLRRLLIEQAGARGAKWFADSIDPGPAPSQPVQWTVAAGIVSLVRKLLGRGPGH
jgi:hypothetical protein